MVDFFSENYIEIIYKMFCLQILVKIQFTADAWGRPLGLVQCWLYRVLYCLPLPPQGKARTYAALSLSTISFPPATAAPFLSNTGPWSHCFVIIRQIMRDISVESDMVTRYKSKLYKVWIKTSSGHGGARMRVKNWAGTRRNLARGISGSILCLMNYITLPNMLQNSIWYSDEAGKERLISHWVVLKH